MTAPFIKGTTALVLFCVAVGQVADGAEPPEALRNLLAPTSGTAHISWTSSVIGGRDDGLVEHYVTQRAGTGLWDKNTGDLSGQQRTYYRLPEKSSDNAVAAPSALEELPPEENPVDNHLLLYDGRVWDRDEEDVVASLSQIESDGLFRRPVDPTRPSLAVRAVGSGWERPEHFGLDSSVLEGFDGAKWTTTSDGEIDTISAEFGLMRLEWQLDRGRGGLPIRAAFYAGGSLRNRSEAELVEIDGRWRTGRSAFYFGDATTPYTVIEVEEASFDQPWHLQEITPDDIGVVYGTRLYGAMVDGEYMGYWNGAEPISSKEYRELLTLYDVMPHPSIVEGIAKLSGRTVEEQYRSMRQYNAAVRAKYYLTHGETPWLSVTSKEKDEWDLYVEKFIKEHKFDKPRIKRAQDVLERAKKLRDVYLRKHISDIRKAERRRDTKRLAIFDAHTEKVFERVLVRRLKRLAPKKPAPKKTASNE